MGIEALDGQQVYTINLGAAAPAAVAEEEAAADESLFAGEETAADEAQAPAATDPMAALNAFQSLLPEGLQDGNQNIFTQFFGNSFSFVSLLLGAILGFMMNQILGGQLPAPVAETPEEEPVDETEDPDGTDPVDETEDPAEEQPVDEEPVDEEPVDEEPVDEEPVDEEPADEEPAEETPDPANSGNDGNNGDNGSGSNHGGITIIINQY